MVRVVGNRSAFRARMAFALAAVILAGTTPARVTAAEPTAREKARAIVAEGEKAFRAGDMTSALKHFQSAYDAFPSPKLFYNFALAYEGLNKPAQAVAALDRFLEGAQDADPSFRTDARRRLQRLSRLVGYANVACEATDVEAFLDGVSIGTLPRSLRLPVDPGRHDLVVRSQTLGSRSLAFTARAGQSVAVEVPLRGSGAGGAAAQTPSSPPPAAVSDEAEQLVRQGVELRKQRKHLQAYDLFRRAFELSPLPRPTAQLGLVEYQLGRWVDAELHLERALQSARDPFIAENLPTIRQALDVVRSHIGFIDVKGKPPGADVTVNDRQAGKLPLPDLIKVSEGYAEVTVSAPGLTPARRTLKVEPGLTQELFVTLDPPSSGAAAPPFTPDGPTSPLVDRTGAPGAGGISALRVTGVVVALGGLAAAGYGVFQTYKVQQLSHDIRRDNQKGVDDGRTAERRQWLGYGLAAAGLGAGALCYWLGRPRDSDSVALSVTGAPGSFLMSLRLAH